MDWDVYFFIPACLYSTRSEGLRLSVAERLKKVTDRHLILGRYKGKAWRIGLMGYSCSRENVVFLLAALEVVLSDRRCEIGKDVGISEAVSCFNKIQA